MSVVAYTTLANDARPGNDTLSTSVDISDAQQVSVTYPSMLCAGEDAVMTVAHPLTGTALWMIGNDTLALAGVDSTITLSNVTADTTITVSTVSTEEELILIVPTSSWSGVDGPAFTTTQPLTIDSVTIYPQALTGTETVSVYDQLTGVVISTATISWTVTNTYDPVRVALGTSVGVGNYALVRSAPVGNWREHYVGSVYPMYSNDSTLYLTGQFNYSTYLSYFYNWKFTVGGCDREDTTFTVGVHPDPVASITVDSANATITVIEATGSG